MTTSPDRLHAARRTARRRQLLLERQQAAIRRRRTGLTLRRPQKLPLTIGGKVVGRLQDRTVAL